MHPRVLCFALAMAACAPTEGPPASTPLVVEVAGCAVVHADGTCEIRDRDQLTLWVDVETEAQVSVRDPRGPVTARAHRLPEGRRLEVEVGDGPLQVVAELDAARAVHRVRLRRSEPVAFLEAARALRDEGHLEDAAALLEEWLEQPLPPAIEAEAAGLLARVVLSAGRIDDAIDRLDASANLAEEAGLVSRQVEDTLAAVYTLAHQRRSLAEARTRLDDVSEVAATYPEGRARLLYYRSQVHTLGQDHRSAIRDAAEAERLADRYGLADLRTHAMEWRSLLLAHLGRYTEAAELQQRVLDAMTDQSACDRAVAEGLLALQTARLHPHRPDVLDTLEAESEGGVPCQTPLRLHNLRARIALQLARAGRTATAARVVEALRTEGTDDARQGPWLNAAGEVALQRGAHREARALFEELAERASARAEPSLRWEALIGLARVAEADGRLDDALAAHAEAEALLGRSSHLVPLGLGRGAWLEARAWGVGFFIDLLVRRGRAAEALSVVRRTRNQLLRDVYRAARLPALDGPARAAWDRHLEAYHAARAELEVAIGEDWTHADAGLPDARRRREALAERARVALDHALALLASANVELPPPPSTPGEVLLTWHPIPEGWLGFAATTDGVAAARLPSLPSDAAPALQSELLLAPFRAQLEGATRLRVMPTGPLRAVDFHALPWKGDVLLAAVPVVYAVDLGNARTGHAGEPAALLVSDPEGNLPQGRSEAVAVERALADSGWRIAHFAGPEALSAPPALDGLRSALGSARLLHYIGHGVTQGPDGWESALPLASGRRLEVSDILALPAVPPYVVLAGCRTGAAGDDGSEQSLSVAHAFLLAGSAVVLATTREVPDDPTFARLLHAQPELRADQPDLAVAAQRALLAWRAADPQADWAAWRTLAR